jgi:hypothetical protein
MKETFVEYDCPVRGKLKILIETKPVGHGPGSGTLIRISELVRIPQEEEAMYKLPQSVYDEVMASTISLGLKLLAKEYRVLEDLRKSLAKSRAKVAHEGDPCIHCRVPHDDVAPGPCLARVSELVRIVSELDKTADGVPITPKTKLWQAHPQRGYDRNWVPHPWSVGPGWSWQRNSDLQVYSTEEAARKAEL